MRDTFCYTRLVQIVVRLFCDFQVVSLNIGGKRGAVEKGDTSLSPLHYESHPKCKRRPVLHPIPNKMLTTSTSEVIGCIHEHIKGSRGRPRHLTAAFAKKRVD